MKIVACFEVINNAPPPQLLLSFYMCIAFHCMQTKIFLQKGKYNAEQEANYKES